MGYNVSMKKGHLTAKNIEKLARLSSLQVPSSELQKYEKQLDETLSFVENLDELKTDEVKPTNHVTELENVGFDDGEGDKRGLSKEQALANGKNKKDGMFVVKRLIE